MKHIKVKFFNHEWGNYQGGEGKVITMQKIYDLPDNTPIVDVKNMVVELISSEGYHDDWEKNHFTGRGIINITII